MQGPPITDYRLQFRMLKSEIARSCVQEVWYVATRTKATPENGSELGRWRMMAYSQKESLHFQNLRKLTQKMQLYMVDEVGNRGIDQPYHAFF
jgi:hypothetical protein